MKLVDVVELTQKAIAQTMGDEYMEKLGDFAELDSYKLADVGRDVTSDTVINSFSTGLLALIGKHVIDNRLYTTNLPSLYVDSFDWGGYIERTRIGLGDIMSDPMYNLVAGNDYSAIEHTYYGQDVHSKIYGEAKAIMCPISVQKETIREAFTSMDKLNEFISAKLQKIKSTINLALATYEKMLVSSAVAVSDKKNNSAVHLITEATNLGILSKVTGENRNMRYDELDSLDEATLRKFLAFCSKRISDVRGYMLDPSTTYNDSTIPTWCDKDPNLILLKDFESMTRFNLKANTYNKDELGFGAYDTIPSWQAIQSSTSEGFDKMICSSIKIAADPTNKLGIGTEAYNVSGVVGLMFDYMAIGIALMRNKVTTSYTACADFWNEFNHQLVNYLIDSSYGIVAFIMD